MHADLAAVLARPIAHRGLHACGGSLNACVGSGPIENSLGAARAAIAAGYGIECDVLLSRDGEAMVFHDDELTRLTGCSGRLVEHDAAALGALSLGGGEDRIPTLRQLLETIDGRVPLVVEIKTTGDTRLVERTLAVLAGYAGPAVVESFDPNVVRHAKAANISRPVGLVGPIEAGAVPDPDVVAACDFLSWSIDDLSRIAGLHGELPLTTWTVRTPTQAAAARRHGAQIVFEGFTPSIAR